MKLASFHAWSCQRIKHQQLVDKQDTTRQHKYEYPQWHLSDINQSASVAKWSGQRTNFWPRMTPQTAWARFYELQISSSLFISFKQETTSTPTKLSDVTRIGNEVWASSTNWIFTPVIQRLMQTDKMTRIHKETQHRSLEKKPNLEQNSWLVENWKAKPIVQCRNSKYYTPENRGFTQTYKTKLNSLTGSRKTQTHSRLGGGGLNWRPNSSPQEQPPDQTFYLNQMIEESNCSKRSFKITSDSSWWSAEPQTNHITASSFHLWNLLWIKPRCDQTWKLQGFQVRWKCRPKN